MVDPAGLHVRKESVGDAVVQEPTPVALPVDVASDPLGRQFSVGYIGQGTKMDVRKMRKTEHAYLLVQPETPIQPCGRGR